MIKYIDKKLGKAQSDFLNRYAILRERGFDTDNAPPAHEKQNYKLWKDCGRLFKKIESLKRQLAKQYEEPLKEKRVDKKPRKRPSQRTDFYSSRGWRDLRYKAITANNGKCEACGRGKHDGITIHVDHIKPRSKHPELELTLSNLQILCDDCNLGKSNKDDTDWRSGREGGYANLAEAAIALVLHQPEIAHKVNPGSLDGLEGFEVDLLRELLMLVKSRDESTTALLLETWPETPEGDLLTKLSAKTLLIPMAGIEQQFLDTIQVLTRAPQLTKLSAQVDRLKRTNYEGCSEIEKQQLRDMLAERNRRDCLV
jgi:5-methylcytosine-specific restriction endonuclease McrA